MSSKTPHRLLSALVAPLALFGVMGCTETSTTAPSADAAADTGTVTDNDTGTVADNDTGTVADNDTGEAPGEDVVQIVDDKPDLPAEDPVVASSCDLLVAGNVANFMVDGMARSFILTLPTGATATGGHWPVVFNWHGLGDTAANMDGLFSGNVNNTAMPFILVTPESTHLGPTTSPLGIEWENLRATTPNREARLFDAVLHCIDQRWGVDPDRVYTAGFSAGAIMSDLLGVLRGSQIAAVTSYSGGYFSDPANPPTLGALRTYPQWPALPSSGHFAQLMLFGGDTDSFNLFVAMAHFDVFAGNDVGYLNARHHDVILCNHNHGHTVPSTLVGRQVIEFFAAHPRGVGPSPYAAGLPSDFPSYCTFRPRSG